MDDQGTALITGASSGIGAVYADRLAKRGYDLILVARDKSRLQALADRLSQETGRKVDVLQADLTVGEDLGRIESRLQTDASITMLVNNAGMPLATGFLESSTDQIAELVALNITAPTAMARVAAKAFLSRERGAIITISSVTALAPERFEGAYSGSKAFVLNLTLALVAELEPNGVRVQAVLPGVTRTEIWARSGRDINALPPEMVMETHELVDAALVGLDLGETVTIPSLPAAAEWETLNGLRLAMLPRLSRSEPAERYRQPGLI